MISSNSMLQMNIREGYRIMTLEVVELIEDLISYLRNAQISKVFYEAAYSAKVKIEDLSNTLTLILSKTAQRQSSSVVSNRSTALITNKFSVALLTKLAILNNANVALVDAVHYSVIDALTITLIKDDNDLLGTINSYIKPPLKRCKTKVADSRHAKASRGRTKKDKDLEDSNTSSDVLRLRRRDRAAACAQLAKRKYLLDSDDYCLDSSLDINPKDDLEDEEATTAKDLLTDAYILYFKELLSNNSRIFANAIGIGKMRAIIEVQNAQAESNVTEYNAVNNNDKLYPTKGERTFYCADSPLENIGRLTKEEAIEMQINTTNAISKALAAANKLVALQSYVLEGVIASYSALATLKVAQFKTYSSCKVKRFTLNSVKDLFTNLSKDYFLLGLREKFSNESVLVMQGGMIQHEINLKLIIVALIAFAEAITLTEATHVIIIEPQDSIVYFNLDSKLELKVLGKQDVKTTS
ncbi:hypothetical protein HBH42_077600 [Parastagonospora nodorum]|nr:hypothetical protein HBH42_077600 [Parastagonospora nodorum]